LFSNSANITVVLVGGKYCSFKRWYFRFTVKVHHHHHWLECPALALAFLRSFRQLKYPAIASSDFVTIVFSRMGLSAPRPTLGYPGEPMFSVRVFSHS
jgi:hypothetical protein